MKDPALLASLASADTGAMVEAMAKGSSSEAIRHEAKSFLNTLTNGFKLDPIVTVGNSTINVGDSNTVMSSTKWIPTIDDQ